MHFHRAVTSEEQTHSKQGNPAPGPSPWWKIPNPSNMSRYFVIKSWLSLQSFNINQIHPNWAFIIPFSRITLHSTPPGISLLTTILKIPWYCTCPVCNSVQFSRPSKAIGAHRDQIVQKTTNVLHDTFYWHILSLLCIGSLKKKTPQKLDVTQKSDMNIQLCI